MENIRIDDDGIGKCTKSYAINKVVGYRLHIDCSSTW